MVGCGFFFRCGVGEYGICIVLRRHVFLNVGGAMFVYNIIVDFVDITIMGTFSHKGWDD